VPIKKHARGVVGGIVSAFKHRVPEFFQTRTWEHCIELSRTGGYPYTLTQVAQDMSWHFKSYYENDNNVLHSEVSASAPTCVPECVRARMCHAYYCVRARVCSAGNRSSTSTRRTERWGPSSRSVKCDG
jgi:hypothetical protein